MSITNKYKKLDEAVLKQLHQVSTATLHTALFKRGLRNTYIQGVSQVNNTKVKMVGQAFTLRYIPAREDLDTVAAFKDPEHPQRLAVESVPEGMILVSDCRQDASAASAGSILLTRLEFRKCAGFVSDAGIRDFEGASAMNMPIFCTKASAPTNLTKHHGVDLEVPIGCGGVAVYPGDVLVGDGDGIIVIPLEIADEISAEAIKMEAFEDYVITKVRAGSAVIGLYPPNDEAQREYNEFIAS
ncbi:ribonuclease activity regulator RraA [Marinomonas rhizomae]|uniref:Regulator of RNase E activity RraA n=1 Tax=Marinomonas rhizomae TaxID=491948 RepID=A0A366J176_9GAMM|nr:ribonuclease activity regulator RraA [Marinomonas rhizomae]RBP80014.1 regulator of RNase E activity RraA [Marinomonas rhizomae]RNF71942.1 ribonuclease activity regulator RraA [Marinomonas rhizomae]